jgi:dihydrofolate reductase
MNDTPKVVFSKTLEKSEWQNAQVVNGNIADEITKLKKQPGGDIIVYGGADFVSNLILAGLIDEFHLFVNPAAIGNGLTIFKERTNLQLIKATSYSCGVVVLYYQPVKSV